MLQLMRRVCSIHLALQSLPWRFKHIAQKLDRIHNERSNKRPKTTHSFTADKRRARGVAPGHVISLRLSLPIKLIMNAGI